MTGAVAEYPSEVGRTSDADWFSRGGFDVLGLGAGAWDYAKRLVRYISSDSTVRVRCLEQFGYSPTLTQIAELRAAWRTRCETRANNAFTYGLRKYGKVDQERVKAEAAKVVPFKPAAVKLAEVVAPEPEPEPATVIARHQLVTVTEVIDACAEACGITHGELIGSIRSRKFVRARNLCAAILRARGNSLPNVGRKIGGRDHTTIMNNIRRFFERDLRDADMQVAWQAMAPCIAKAARSFEELQAMVGVGR